MVKYFQPEPSLPRAKFFPSPALLGRESATLGRIAYTKEKVRGREYIAFPRLLHHIDGSFFEGPLEFGGLLDWESRQQPADASKQAQLLCIRVLCRGR